MTVIHAALRETGEHRPKPNGDHDGETRASIFAQLLGKHVMSHSDEAIKYAIDRGLAAGLDPEVAHAMAMRSMEVWHPELTVREFAELVDVEIKHDTKP